MEHFDRFGDVVDVFIPDPWRHFAFVTFAEQRVAASLIGKEHNLKVGFFLCCLYFAYPESDSVGIFHFRPDPDLANQNFKNWIRILPSFTKNQFNHLNFYIINQISSDIFISIFLAEK